eukprot:10566820-Karenia_brevis.AAC.1
MTMIVVMMVMMTSEQSTKQSIMFKVFNECTTPARWACSVVKPLAAAAAAAAAADDDDDAYHSGS